MYVKIDEPESCSPVTNGVALVGGEEQASAGARLGAAKEPVGALQCAGNRLSFADEGLASFGRVVAPSISIQFGQRIVPPL